MDPVSDGVEMGAMVGHLHLQQALVLRIYDHRRNGGMALAGSPSPPLPDCRTITIIGRPMNRNARQALIAGE